MTLGVVLILVCCMGVCLATNSTPCVSPNLCLDPLPQTPCPSHSGLVSCLNQSDCVRSTEFWRQHLNQWPSETGAFCYSTWHDILLQPGAVEYGLGFPTTCQALATILITIRLNQEVGSISDPNVLLLADTAEVQVVGCCSNPSQVDVSVQHRLYTLLMAAYNQYNSSYCPVALQTDSHLPQTPLEWVVLFVVALGLPISIVLLCMMTMPMLVHYSLLFQVWTGKNMPPEFIDRVYYMVLREKHTVSEVLNTQDPFDNPLPHSSPRSYATQVVNQSD